MKVRHCGPPIRTGSPAWAFLSLSLPHQNLPVLGLISPGPALCFPRMSDKPSHLLTELQEAEGSNVNSCSAIYYLGSLGNFLSFIWLLNFHLQNGYLFYGTVKIKQDDACKEVSNIMPGTWLKDIKAALSPDWRSWSLQCLHLRAEKNAVTKR